VTIVLIKKRKINKASKIFKFSLRGYVWALPPTLLPAHGRGSEVGAEQQMAKVPAQCLQNDKSDHMFTFSKLFSVGLTQLPLKSIINFH